jgi:hypothetical protein
MVTMRKKEHWYVVFLDFIKDFFCNKYADIIWCCTLKFRSHLHIPTVAELIYATQFIWHCSEE